MLEFFEEHWRFLIFATILASFVIYSVRKDRQKEEKKEQEKKNAQKKTEESQKDKD